MRDLCVEFLLMLTSEANLIAEKEGKKEIEQQHILLALRSLGFGEYANECDQIHVDKTLGKVCCSLMNFSSLMRERKEKRE
jgi:hypothetical protein